MQKIAEGAEAKIFASGDKIIKERTPKPYRLKEIDESLRKQRTRREAKVFSRLKEIGVPVPDLIDYSDKAMTITMERLEGKKVRDILDAGNCERLGRELGRKVGLMHSHNIVHGDLTTSNMIFQDSRVYFIDFGLSLFSARAEDKAVDIHLFRQTLESRHHKFWEKCFRAFIEGYEKTNPGCGEVMERLKKVEARGRYKGKSAETN